MSTNQRHDTNLGHAGTGLSSGKKSQGGRKRPKPMLKAGAEAVPFTNTTRRPRQVPPARRSPGPLSPHPPRTSRHKAAPPTSGRPRGRGRGLGPRPRVPPLPRQLPPDLPVLGRLPARLPVFLLVLGPGSARRPHHLPEERGGHHLPRTSPAQLRRRGTAHAPWRTEPGHAPRSGATSEPRL